ncbi:hypothetical protein T492DRAFT_493521 [Pavlovales sp. CCMP2436]|nr:hypothetical protein T492DRAFT_493521 [Pavlovales sp. CCMP2436]
MFVFELLFLTFHNIIGLGALLGQPGATSAHPSKKLPSLPHRKAAVGRRNDVSRTVAILQPRPGSATVAAETEEEEEGGKRKPACKRPRRSSAAAEVSGHQGNGARAMSGQPPRPHAPIPATTFKTISEKPKRALEVVPNFQDSQSARGAPPRKLARGRTGEVETGDASEVELELNEAVIVARGVRELDGILVGARGNQLQIELLWDHSKVWLARAQVRLMPPAATLAVPVQLRAGSAVSAVDPFSPALSSGSSGEPEWHAAVVVEVKAGAQLPGSAQSQSLDLWFWIRYERTGMHQWLTTEQLAAGGEPHATGRLLRLVSSLRAHAMRAPPG